MALSVKLRDYRSTEIVSIDLAAGTLKVRAGAWTPRATGPEGQVKAAGFGAQYEWERFGAVTETLTLYGEGTATALRAAVFALHRALEMARHWHTTQLDAYPVWLEVASDGETARRALIYHGAIVIKGDQPTITPLLDFGRVELVLTLVRHPFWETTTVDAQTKATPLSWLGGQWDFTAEYGSAPSRIARFEMTTSGSQEIGRFWLGFRPLRWATLPSPATLTTCWECEDGTLGTDAALAGVTGASPSGSTNNFVRVTYATTTLAKRLTISVADVMADAVNQTGRYLILARCKCSAGTTGVQLRTGTMHMPDNLYVQNAEVYITNTVWRLIPLGEFQIPAPGLRHANTAGDSATATMQIWTEQVSGSSTTFDLDCLILIPNEYMISGVVDTYAVPPRTDFLTTLYTLPDDTQVGVYEYGSNENMPVIELTPHNWYLPTGGATLVFALEQETVSPLATDLGLEIDFQHRFFWYRSS